MQLVLDQKEKELKLKDRKIKSFCKNDCDGGKEQGLCGYCSLGTLMDPPSPKDPPAIGGAKVVSGIIEYAKDKMSDDNTVDFYFHKGQHKDCDLCKCVLIIDRLKAEIAKGCTQCKYDYELNVPKRITDLEARNLELIEQKCDMAEIIQAKDEQIKELGEAGEHLTSLAFCLIEHIDSKEPACASCKKMMKILYKIEERKDAPKPEFIPDNVKEVLGIKKPKPSDDKCPKCHQGKMWPMIWCDCCGHVEEPDGTGKKVK